MATLLAQARTLETLAQQSKLPVGTPLDDVVRRELAPLALRATIAERKVANIEKVLHYFGEQSQVVPSDHPQRQVVETMIATLRGVIEAVDKQATEEAANKEG